MAGSKKKKRATVEESAGRKSKAELVTEVIEKVEQRLAKGDLKPTLADLARLWQMEKELEQEEEQPREIKVSWVESSEKDDASEK